MTKKVKEEAVNQFYTH